MKKSSTGSLLAISASFAAMMIATAAPAYAQDEAQADDAADQPAIIVTGTRRTDRTVADSPVPVDVLSAADLVNIRFEENTIDYDGDGDATEGMALEIETMREQLYVAMQAYATETVGTGILYLDTAFTPGRVQLPVCGQGSRCVRPQWHVCFATPV